SAAAAWPVLTRAQQGERMWRVAILLPATSDDLDYQAFVAAFLQTLGQLGWIVGRNMRVDTRWATPAVAAIRKHSAEFAQPAPDVILAHGGATVAPLLQATRTVPIVFPVVADPVGAGFVDNLARPGGNATGFMNLEYGLAGKWLELLKEIAPDMKRAAIIRDTANPTGIAMFGIIQAMAASVGVGVTPINLRDAGEFERSVAAFARVPNGGLVVTPSAPTVLHRNLIVALAAQYKLPAVYFERTFVAAGGLASYGADFLDQYRQAANYVDRILKGEKPAEMPVQAPTKYQLVINLKTAKEMGFTFPPAVLARADEGIE